VNNQIVFLVIMALLIGVVLLFSRQRLKALTAIAVFISPWQGGLWLEYFSQDLLLSTILYIMIALIILFSKRQRKTYKLSKRIYWPILLPALGMIISASFSSRGAMDPFAARGGMLILLERYLAFFCVYNIIEKPGDLKIILFALAGSLAFQSVLGILQFRMASFHIGVIDADQSWQSWRANGTFYHANALGMYLLILMTMVYRFLLLSLKKKSWQMQVFLLGVFVLSFSALIATQNRGSWIGFIAGLLVVFSLDMTIGRTRVQSVMGKLAIPVLVVVFFLTVKYGNFVYQRLFQDDMTQQIEGRKELEVAAQEVIRAYPVWGVGWGNYQLHASTYEFTHNCYLLIMSELGYVGFFFFIWFVLVWLWEIFRAWKSKNIVVRNLSLGGLGGLIAFLIASIPGPDYMIIRQVGTHVWIVVGLLSGLNYVSRKYDMNNVLQTARQRELPEPEVKRLQAYVTREWESTV